METLIRDRQEVAEKVAGMLGIEVVMQNAGDQVRCIATKHYNFKFSIFDLEHVIFKHPATPIACIEKAREKGWEIDWSLGRIRFARKYHTPCGPNYTQERELMTVNGDIEAIIRAFAEIPND